MINLPDKLFSGLSLLNTIKSQAVTPPYLGQSTFAGCNNGNLRGVTLTVPSGSENLYKQAVGWCEFYGTCGEGIEEIEVKSGWRKIMLDGSIYIQRDGKLYNATGSQVK